MGPRVSSAFDPTAPLRADGAEPGAYARGLRIAFLGMVGAQAGLAAIVGGAALLLAPGAGPPADVVGWTLLVASALQPILALVVASVLPSADDAARRAAIDAAGLDEAALPTAIARAAYLAELRRMLLVAILLAAPAWYASLYAASGGRGLFLIALLFLALAQPPLGAAAAGVAGARAARAASDRIAATGA